MDAAVPIVAWQEFARAPLVPAALCAAAGLCVDRYVQPDLGPELVAAAIGLVGFLARLRQADGLVWLWLATAALAAGGHHIQIRQLDADDISHVARSGPVLVRVRGILLDDPATRRAPADDPLEPRTRGNRDLVPLRVRQVETPSGWAEVSGSVRLSVGGDDEPAATPMRGLRAADRVEVVGLFSIPGPPRNPGEKDIRSVYLDHGWRGDLRAHSAALVTRLDAGPVTLAGTLAGTRRVATDALAAALPSQTLGPATALLLGDGNAMEQSEWAGYIRTGVVHALAISGSHLAVLAGVLWASARAFNVRRAHAAWLVIIVVCGYALLTGLRPSGVRAAVMVTCVCLGVALRLPVNRANSFALAWLITAILNPADPFSLGSKLSFLSVFVLIWGIGPWFVPSERTPQQILIAESRGTTARAGRAVIRAIGRAYGITFALGLVNAPLQLAEQNIASPVGLIIGPAIVLLTEFALISGLFLILLSPLPFVGSLLGYPVDWSLAACSGLVHAADALPGGAVYLPGVSLGWLIGFHLLLVAIVLAPRPWNRRAGVALAAWTVVALLLPHGANRPEGEMRLTVLAVGKGGCAVIETPDGRTIVYDAGTTAGPNTIARVVAPYLWYRGIRRVDELILSHADFDHFNGVGELRRRFPIGRVTLTPSFADKPTREVAGALAVLNRYKIPSELAFAGQTRTAGEVTFEVLHPPRNGPSGSENERSLVLKLTHAGHAILLTGDLEKSGTQALLSIPAQHCEVLLAPHHGSRAALPSALLAWCQPRLVIVSRGPPLGNSVTPADVPPGVPLWDTYSFGAVTLRSHATGLVAESYLSGERVVVARGISKPRPFR